jgi:thiamine pyrophosphate-dependent acetolactate synthase large subunit-like protein
LVVALDAIGVTFNAIRHETNAVLAAEGYAAATGRLGIAVIGRGPAAANGMHGIVAVSKVGTPVLIIMGEDNASPGPNAVGPDYKGYNAPGVMMAAGLQVFKAPNGEC